ncbi:type IV secretion system protein [Variovorax saccharolyticus]|uniref:type IV secretion system protein n=1 Tax=Variovorax saccharolyticus TaxID=3053516 RepID=UPI002576834B|nr:type IV secretion system protein [Variovorax sp. J22R187]MDM0022686.1 type IV secretion system protein [Variovorax sp. J22R187]
MGFFEQFFVWLNGQLATYVSTNTAKVAVAIEPAAVTLGTVYVMIWGYLCLTGRIQEPVWEGIKRILVVAVVLGSALRLWSYNEMIVDTFTRAPDQLAAAILGSRSTITVVDQIWIDGNLVAEQLLSKGSLLNSNFAFYIAGFVVYFMVGLTVVVTAFLFALSKVALSLILALGPIFIVLLFFDATKRFFEAWIAQLANYALITLLATMAAALLLSVLRSYASNASALGGAITIAESARVCIASALVFLVMRQVMAIAAGLASGISLSSFNAVSTLMRWGMGGARRTTYEFGRGVLDGLRREPGSRWDSLRRLAGNRVGTGVANTWERVGGARRGGTVVPREQVMPNPHSLR